MNIDQNAIILIAIVLFGFALVLFGPIGIALGIILVLGGIFWFKQQTNE